MKFDQHGWINDIVVGTVTGALSGAVGALFLPDPPVGITTLAGGVAGLATGLINIPLRWILDRRPVADDPEMNGDRDA